MKQVTIKSGTRYLSEVDGLLSSFGDHAIIDKGKTGCGYTETLIRSGESWIIAVPHISLCDSKYYQHLGKETEILAIYGGITYDDFLSYVRNNTGRKVFMVTYDSTDRLTKWIDRCLYTHLNEFSLAIDEGHAVANSYKFRTPAITRLLSVRDMFKRVHVCTATPSAWIPYELDDFDTVVLDWDDAEVNKANLCRVSNCKQALVYYVKKHAFNNTKNHYFFYNNVSGIIQTIEKLIEVMGSDVISPDTVRIITAANPKNRKDIKERLGEGWIIGSAGDSPKKLNFITSCAFCGTDFYDTNALVHAVCEHVHDSARLDPATEILQLVGRIRNIERSIGILYSVGGEERDVYAYKEQLEIKRQDMESMVARLNSGNVDYDAMLLASGYMNENKHWIAKDDNGVYRVSENAARFDNQGVDKMNLYTNEETFIKSLINSKFTIMEQTTMNIPTEDKVSFGQDGAFERTVKLLGELETKESITEQELSDIEVVLKSNKDIAEMYNVLGYDGIESTGFKKSHARQKAIVNSEITPTFMMYRLLGEAFKPKSRYTNKVIASRLKEIYEACGVKKHAKATDLSEWFGVIKCKIPAKDGKRADGWEVTNTKFNVLDAAEKDYKHENAFVVKPDHVSELLSRFSAKLVHSANEEPKVPEIEVIEPISNYEEPAIEKMFTGNSERKLERLLNFANTAELNGFYRCEEVEEDVVYHSSDLGIFYYPHHHCYYYPENEMFFYPDNGEWIVNPNASKPATPVLEPVAYPY